MSFTCIPVQIEPNKSPLRKRLLALLFERLATFPPQADHVFVDLVSSVGVSLWAEAPPPPQVTMQCKASLICVSRFCSGWSRDFQHAGCHSAALVTIYDQGCPMVVSWGLLILSVMPIFWKTLISEFSEMQNVYAPEERTPDDGLSALCFV